MPLTDQDRAELDALPPYDVAGARAAVAKYRTDPDPATRVIIDLGDEIARRIAGQIGGAPAEQAAAARAVIIAAGILGTCLAAGVDAMHVLNAAGVAGDTMMTLAGAEPS